MSHTTSYPPPEFYSSPYDPKWWLDPPFESTDNFSHQSPISTDDFSQEDDSSYIDDFFPDQSHLTFQEDDFSYEWTPESQDKFCDFSKFPTYQDDTCEFSPQNGSATNASNFSPNWYVDDLYDQLRYLEKLPSQSVKNYLSEAKSLAYALAQVDAPIDEQELIVCITEGLDDDFYQTVHTYCQLMNPSVDDFSTFLFAHEKRVHSRQSSDPIQASSEHHPTHSDIIRQSSDPIESPANPIIASSDPIAPILDLIRPPSDRPIPIIRPPPKSYGVMLCSGPLVHSILYGSSFSPASLSKSELTHTTTMVAPDPSSAVINFVLLTSSPSDLTLRHLGFGFGTSIGSKRSLRFASYFWIDVIIMHVTLLFNLSRLMCVFSILRGVCLSLALQSHGYFPQFKLQLRFLPFRLRGRIREIT